MKILTNHPGQSQSQTWADFSDYVRPENYSLTGLLKHSIELIRKRKKYDVLVLGAGRADLVFLLTTKIFPPCKIKCIVIDCLWYENKSKPLHYIKKTLFKIADTSVDKYVVWASREIDAYSKTFGLPKEKFVFIPYHHTVNDEEILITPGNYIFSGGNFARDYSTLINAVRGLSVRLLIASTRHELFEGISIPNNVVIDGFSHKEYLQKMAQCSINVVALAPGLLHSGGQQTFLNSMFFGKPTIVCDQEGAADYITHGEDGLLVEPGNPRELKNAILYLLENPQKAYEIGKKGKQKAMQYSTENHFRKIVELSKEIL